jgi:hypothetical protein
MDFFRLMVGAVARLSDAVPGLVGVSEEQAAINTVLVTARTARLKYRQIDIDASLDLSRGWTGITRPDPISNGRP